jgi:hypothetical protein
MFKSYPTSGKLVLALLSYAFCSLLWTPRPDLAINAVSLAAPYLVTGVILGPLLITRDEDVDTALATLIVVGTVACVFLLFFAEWGRRGVVLPGTIGARGEAQTGNPLAIAQMAGNVVMASVLSNVWKRSALWKIARWGVVILCLAVVMKSGSRGQLLATVLGCLMFWPLSRTVRGFKTYFLWGSLILFMVVAIDLGLRTFSEEADRWSEARISSDVTGRWEMGSRLVARWWDGSAFTIIAGLGNSASNDPRILGTYPHVVPLEVLAEEGLVGAALLAGILLTGTGAARRYYRYGRRDKNKRAILAVIAAMFFASFLLTLKQGSLLGNADFLMFAVLLGRIEVLERAKRRNGEVVQSPAHSMIARPNSVFRGTQWG